MDDCYVSKLSWTKEADFLSSWENFIISIMIISVAEYDKKVCREGETNQSCGNRAPATPPPWLRGQKMIYEDIAICLVAASWSVSTFWLAISYYLAISATYNLISESVPGAVSSSLHHINIAA